MGPTKHLSSEGLKPGGAKFHWNVCSDVRLLTGSPAGSMAFRCRCGKHVLRRMIRSWFDGQIGWNCPVCHWQYSGSEFVGLVLSSRRQVLDGVRSTAELS